MDESIIFVDEVDNENNNPKPKTSIRNESRRRKADKENIKPIYVVDLTRDSGEFKLSSTYTPSNVLKENHKEQNKAPLQCPMCLEPLQNLELRVTYCGHIFCKVCLDALIHSKKQLPLCPVCRGKIRKSHLRPVYL